MIKRNTLTRISCLLVFVFAFAVGISSAEAAYDELRVANGGATVPTRRFIPSTEPVIPLALGGISKTAPLRDVLEVMAANNMRGTFFISTREVDRNRDNIALILSYGQDLGIAITTQKNGSFEGYCRQIEYVKNALRNYFGVETNIARQMGSNDESINEAASAMGVYLVGQTINAVQSKHQDAQSVDEIMKSLFSKGTTSLNRGAVLYIRTDFYNRDDLVAGLLLAIKKEKIDNIAYNGTTDNTGNNPENDSAYRLVSIQDMLNNTSYLYDYPVNSNKIPVELSPDNHATHVDNSNFSQEFMKRYIGAPEVSADDRMLGFSRSLMAKADRTGVVKTVTDNTVFLTFDDWGMDDSINKLLYVLRKHNVKGTFFIITRNVLNNPNLLRAIAAEGHEIGSHTDQHIAMAVQDEKGRQYSPQTREVYANDVATSYEKLVSILGDTRLENGRPALTRLMRPPTLAISRMGVEEILNAGFAYIVNGYGSTEDYGAVSLQSLVGIMSNIVQEKKGVRNGSILIMHMSVTASKTAEALDILLTANEARPDGDPHKFKVGLLGDYLIGDYDQRMKQPEPDYEVNK